MTLRGRDPFPKDSPQVRDMALDGSINILIKYAKEAKKRRAKEDRSGIRFNPFFSREELQELESARWSFNYYSGDWER